MPQPSSAVIAAQLELHKRRSAIAAKAETARPPVSLAAAVSQLPSHLGWRTHAFTAHLRKKTACPRSPAPEITLEGQTAPKAQPLSAPKVKHYPSIGIQALEQKQVPHYQVWLMSRYLDESGRGWLSLKQLRHQLTTPASALRLFGWRRLRQVLHQGQGRFWAWNPHQDRLWLFGAAKIGLALNCPKLSGAPVYLPLPALLQGVGIFKAHLYTAWHSGRRSRNPISRQTLHKLTTVPERTQRYYEKQTHTKVKANLAIGAPDCPESIEQHTWQRGGAVFKFIDKNGRFGAKQKSYLAWQLPNSYVGPHEQAAQGRHRRINHQLTDLVHKGAQGNSEPKIKRTYFDHGKDAAKAVQSQTETVAYWPEGESRAYSLWHLFFYA